MRHFKFLLLLALLTFLRLPVKAQSGQKLHTKPDLLKIIDRNLKDAVKQYKILMKHIPADSLPETFEKGQWTSNPPKSWISGFYPGTLLYLYEATKDRSLYNEAMDKLKVLEGQKFADSHDIGFIMFCSYGNANRLKPQAPYKDILLTSAATLSKRFNPSVGCTMSWGSKPGEFRVIIDNMMNLELLTWASKASGDPSFADIAIKHANTTMKNHFRPDYSTYHLVNYNSATGEVIRRQTVQGAADESAWARGQSWGLYGYTMMYRETGKAEYLQQAKNIANFLLSHPNLPADKIPYWDYNAPGIPNTYRDASAAAIMASALIELAGYSNEEDSKRYLETSETIMRSLSGETYKAKKGENGGYILKHSVSHLPRGNKIDVPLTYADYYFVEAMMRYKNLSSKN